MLETLNKIQSSRIIYDAGEEGLITIQEYFYLHSQHIDATAAQWTEDQESFDEWARIAHEEAIDKLRNGMTTTIPYIAK